MPGLAQALLGGNNLRVGVFDFFEAPALTLPFPADDSIWLPLGVAEPGSLKFDPQIEEYEFVSGLPETTKKLYKVAMKGQCDINISEYTAFALRAAVGGDEPAQLYRKDTEAGKIIAAAGSTQSQVKFTTAADALAFNIDDEVEVQVVTTGTTTNIGFGSGKAISYVTARDGAAGTIDVYPKLFALPKATDGLVKAIGGWKQFVGTATVRQKAYRAIFTDINGEQVVIWIPKAQSSGGFAPNAPNKKELMLPLKLKAFGVTGTSIGEATIGSKPIVAITYILKDQSGTNGATTGTNGVPLAL